MIAAVAQLDDGHVPPQLFTIQLQPRREPTRASLDLNEYGSTWFTAVNDSQVSPCAFGTFCIQPGCLLFNDPPPFCRGVGHRCKDCHAPLHNLCFQDWQNQRYKGQKFQDGDFHCPSCAEKKP